MSEYSAFLAAIKRAATEAVGAAKPFTLTYGEVVRSAPLEIRIDQKLTLTAPQLLLTNAVRDYSVDMTVDHTTESSLGSVSFSHRHTYSGTTEQTGGHNHPGSYLPETLLNITQDARHGHMVPAGQTGGSGDPAHSHPILAGETEEASAHNHPGSVVPQTEVVVTQDGVHAHDYSGVTDSDDIFSGNHDRLSHKHGYVGRKTFRVHLGLKTGERVLLLRIQGGQQYIVLDRVVALL